MKLPEIVIGPETLKDLEKSERLEWLITNGTGCYASSSAIGMNTRKYHGLLIASKNPPLDRKVILSKLDEEVCFKKEDFKLSTNRFLDVISPEGYKNQVSFKLNPFPEFTFHVKNIEIKKSVFLVHKKNISIVRYEVSNPKKLFFKIKIRPLINYRSIYELKKKNEVFKVKSNKNKVILHFNKSDYLTIKGKNFKENGLKEEDRWYKNFYYKRDIERGEDSIENNYCPGVFEFEIKKKNEVFYVISGYCVGDSEFKEPKKLIKNEIKRKEKLLKLFYGKNKAKKDNWIKWLVISLDQHLINDNSIIAGYQWFGEWGRDSLISIPGFLKLGKEKEVKNILKFFGSHMKNGLIPNMLARGKMEKTIYNTVDASLWFTDRIYRTYKKTGDKRFLEEMKPMVKSIIENHIKGTDFQIKMDNDGLLNHGPGLTWMDAKVEGKCITPRSGKAIEIQGLWYNSLMIAHEILDEKKYLELAKKVKKSFNENFWNGEYLDDVLGDKTLRPNQLLILDLPFCIVDDEKKKKVISIIEKELLTSCGLMTLPKDHPKFKGKYEGYFESRDAAYHQGTVWPWPMGAYIRLTGNKELLKLFVEKEINQFGLGSIAEIFDGDQPHLPRGCISQAWSLAEILASI